MDNSDLQNEWPPSDLAEYYKSSGFYAKLATLEKRLDRTYQGIDSHSIIYDSAADLLLKEVASHLIYARYMAKYPTEADFLRYLYETCCRKVIDEARSFQRRFRQLDNEENIPDSGLSPEQIAIEQEEVEKNQRLVRDLRINVLNRLTKVDKLIFKHRIAGQTLQEIASQLDLGVTTVHRRYRMILKQLADELEGRQAVEKIKPMP